MLWNRSSFLSITLASRHEKTEKPKTASYIYDSPAPAQLNGRTQRPTILFYP